MKTSGRGGKRGQKKREAAERQVQAWYEANEAWILYYSLTQAASKARVEALQKNYQAEKAYLTERDRHALIHQIADAIGFEAQSAGLAQSHKEISQEIRNHWPRFVEKAGPGGFQEARLHAQKEALREEAQAPAAITHPSRRQVAQETPGCQEDEAQGPPLIHKRDLN